MPALPAGTLTFLFTDIEGSTRLLAELGPDAYAAVDQAAALALGYGGLEMMLPSGSEEQVPQELRE
jgi:hypothetical protein